MLVTAGRNDGMAHTQPKGEEMIIRYATTAKQARQIRDALLLLGGQDVRVLATSTWEDRQGSLIFASGQRSQEIDWDDLDNARLTYLRVRVDGEYIAARPWADDAREPFVVTAYLS